MCDLSSTVCLMLCLHDYDGDVLLQDRVGFDGMCAVQNKEGWVLMVCVQYKMEKDGF